VTLFYLYPATPNSTQQSSASKLSRASCTLAPGTLRTLAVPAGSAARRSANWRRCDGRIAALPGVSTHLDVPRLWIRTTAASARRTPELFWVQFGAQPPEGRRPADVLESRRQVGRPALPKCLAVMYGSVPALDQHYQPES
jgi:hypothetical protein